MTENLNFGQAIEALENGKKIKLPEWQGYWFKEDDKIKVMSRTGDVLDTPYLEDYKNRTDWQITNGYRDFGGALTALKAGKKVARQGWNGKGMFIFERPGDKIPASMIPNIKSLPDSVKRYFANKEFTNMDDTPADLDKVMIPFTPYLCMYAADGSIVNGWLASQTDMLSEDWVILD
jgi:hypothetical protein